MSADPMPPDGPWVVGLDLSLRSTGIAYADGSVGVVKTPNVTEGDIVGQMERLQLVMNGVRLAMDCWCSAPDLVVIEGYTYGTTKSAHVLGELGGIVRNFLWRETIPFTVVAPPTLKKYACGTGSTRLKGKTPIVVNARERLGYQGMQDDEADALWLRAAGLHRLGAPIVPRLKTHGAEVIEALPIVVRSLKVPA